jgi:N-dimethylarginine dimethylaminohydrolase
MGSAGTTSPLTQRQPGHATVRARATARRYLMCRPTYFDVRYRINPWMHPERPVDRARAAAQWARLRATYLDLGHRVDLVEPVPGLPDMVFAANSALVVDGRVLAARMRHAERRGEQAPYRSWFRAHGFTDVHVASHVHEGEGDFAVVGGLVLAGFGFRTERAAHDEAARVLGRPVVSLELVDPDYYHLDTALCALDQHNVAYYPAAFSRPSRAALRELFPDAIVATRADAAVLGLNAISDGRHVVVAAQAVGLIDRLRDAGYEPVPVDVSEFAKAGGGVKCCTLELREVRR